ncbi:MAG: MFS transporter [Candidatus Thermoplasmatota archaeon]|nr:MFS transporter [Candidatus Thermoplasmatota archaeon]
MRSDDERSEHFPGGSSQAVNRNVILLIGGGALFNVPIGFTFVAIPIYLERLPGIPTALIGLFFTTMGLVAVAFILPIGILADRFGRRLMLALGGIFATVAILLLAFLDTFEGLLTIAAIFGMAEALYFSTWNALLADASTTETRTRVFGRSFFVTAIAFAVGSLLAVAADRAIQGGATPQEAYQPLFLAMGLLIFIVPAIIPFIHLQRRTPVKSRGLLPRRSLRIITKFFVANFLIGFGAGIIIPIFSLWFLLQFAVAEAFTGPLFAVSSVVNAFAFLLAPRFAKRAGMIRAVVVAQVAATLILFAMPFTAALGAVALLTVSILYVARNALMNMVWPVMSSFLMGAVDPDERSAASAVTGASFRLPFAMSTTLGAYLLTIDLSMPLFLTALLYGLGTGAFWYFFRAYWSVTPEQAASTSAPEAPGPK